ncbi:MAG TPA: aldolase/citrate lyase family protein, partial [Acidimicrobiales bacterium]
MVRSYLYVPGSRPERFSTAMSSGTDAVIFDLEDAVPVAAKPDALDAVVEQLRTPSEPKIQRWVRINAGQLGLTELDRLAGLPELSGVLVPKATSESLSRAVEVMVGIRVIALIESAQGILQLPEIAKSNGITQLAIGEVDLAADLEMSPSPDGRELDSLRLNVVVASAAFGLLPPIGPVWVDIPDRDGLTESTLHLRRLGFGSRQALHPDQIDAIN